MDQQYAPQGMPQAPQGFAPPAGMPGAPAANPYAPSAAPANPNDIYAQFAAQNVQSTQNTGGGGTSGGNTGGLPIVYLGGQVKDANTLIVKIGVHPATPAQYWRDLNRHKIWPDFKKKVHCLTAFGQRCPVCEAADQYLKFLNLPENREYQVKKDYKFIMFAQLLWAERPIMSGKEGGQQRQVQPLETIILMGPSTLRTAIQNTMTTAQAASQVLGPVGLPLKLVFTGNSQSRYSANIHFTDQPVEFHVRQDLPPLNDLMWPKDLTNEAIVEAQNYATRLTEAGMRNMAASTGQAPAQMYPPANTAMGMPGMPPASFAPQGMPPGVPQGMPQGYPPAAPQGYPPAAPQGMPPGVPQQPQYAPAPYQAAPQGMPPGVPQGMPPAMPQAMPQGYPPAAPQPMPQPMPGMPPAMPGMPPAGYTANPNPGAVGAQAPAAPEAQPQQWPAQAAPTYAPSEVPPMNPMGAMVGTNVLAPAMPPAPPAPPEMPSAPPAMMAAPMAPPAAPMATMAPPMAPPAGDPNAPVLPDGTPNSGVLGADGKPVCYSYRPDEPNTKCMACHLEGGGDDGGCIKATEARRAGG